MANEKLLWDVLGTDADLTDQQTNDEGQGDKGVEQQEDSNPSLTDDKGGVANDVEQKTNDVEQQEDKGEQGEEGEQQGVNLNSFAKELFGYEPDNQLTNREEFIKSVEQHYKNQFSQSDPVLSKLVENGISIQEYNQYMGQVQQIENLSDKDLVVESYAERMMVGVEPPSENATETEKSAYLREYNEAKELISKRLENKDDSWFSAQSEGIKKELMNGVSDVFQKIEEGRVQQKKIIVNQYNSAFNKLKEEDNKYLESLKDLGGINITDEYKKGFVDYRNKLMTLDESTMRNGYDDIIEDPSKARTLQFLYYLYENGVFKNLVHNTKAQASKNILDSLPDALKIGENQGGSSKEYLWENI